MRSLWRTWKQRRIASLDVVKLDDLPRGHYFIAHSSADEENLRVLLELIPAHVEPILFYEPRWDLKRPVSEPIIDAIAACDAMLCLSSPQAFWVAMERDIALRLKVPVFEVSVSPAVSIAQNKSNPLDLSIYASYRHTDNLPIRQIIRFMRQKRFIAVRDGRAFRTGDVWHGMIVDAVRMTLAGGGVFVLFLSKDSAQSLWVKEELRVAVEAIPDFRDRLVIAVFDDAEPSQVTSDVHFDIGEALVIRYRSGRWIDWRALDNLIVMIYWMIFRKQFGKVLTTSTQ